jgi:DNA-binding SARP family transcriptional activator
LSVVLELPVRFSILGPLVAEADDGTPLALGRPSQRGTLAVLLLHASQPASKSLLIDALWGDSPPGNADAALRVRMREVRRIIAGNDRIVTHPAGYQIVVRPGELDADDFLGFTSRGRTALDGGNAEDAARLLEQACRLWRDPPLADVPDTPISRAAATALLEQLRATREWLMDARMALGQHHELLSQIRAVVAADPLSEHPHVQLMLALYRCGQKVAALDAYSRLRELTTREFGQDPGPEASQMLRHILDDSAELDYRPRALAVGTSARPGWTPVRQLPAPPPDFTGRVLAIEALARRMPGASVAATVLTGPPGAGKTALAVKAAQLAADSFPDGQLFVNLGGPREPRMPLEVLGQLLRSLGFPPGSVPDALGECAALYRSMLAGRRMLIVADDAAAAAQVRPLIPGTPDSTVLVTASCRLADLEGAQHIDVGPLSDAEALTMLGRIAGEERLRAEPAATEAIIAACAGLPLALRIAGARLATSRAKRVADMAAELGPQPSPGLPPRRLRSALAVGDLSVSGRMEDAWQALRPDARLALWLLAHARQDCCPDWLVGAVTGGSPAVVNELADACLIYQDPATGTYSLAPLVGNFAMAQPVPRSGAVRRWTSISAFQPQWTGLAVLGAPRAATGS